MSERLPLRGVLRTQAAVIWLVFAVTLAVSWLLVALFTDQSFLAASNVETMLTGAVALGLVAAGQTAAILAGSFDLSVAWVASLGAIVTATVMDGDSAMMVPAVAAAALAGLLVGVANGLIITKLKVNAFIATLGVGLILSGVLSSEIETRTGSVSESFRALGYDSVLFVPAAVLLLIGFVVVLAATFRWTRLGHHIYAIGASKEVARLSGIRSDRVLIAAHAICSLGAVLAGVYLASRLGSADPGIGPRGGYDLDSIAVVVLGGTALGGGRGGIWGTVAGVLIFALLDGLFDALQVDPFLKTVIEGAIIIAAVASYSYRNVTRVA